MRALREPDAFPSADRDLARVLALGSSSEFEQRSQAWRPWRAYAAIYLWTFTGEIRACGSPSAPSARKKALRKRMLCTPESKWPWDRLHSINARIHLRS